MDRVKLGRALGYGTRHAVKTLAAVTEAATAPDPRRTGVPPRQPGSAAPAGSAAETEIPVRKTPLTAQVRGVSRSFWAPLATFSGALWLRVTGLFFAIVALTMFGGAWRLRGVVHEGADPQGLRHFWLFSGFAVLFGYFAVSGFVRASLRERRGAGSRR